MTTEKTMTAGDRWRVKKLIQSIANGEMVVARIKDLTTGEYRTMLCSIGCCDDPGCTRTDHFIPLAELLEATSPKEYMERFDPNDCEFCCSVIKVEIPADLDESPTVTNRSRMEH